METQRWIAPPTRSVPGGALDLEAAAHAAGRDRQFASRARCWRRCMSDVWHRPERLGRRASRQEPARPERPQRRASRTLGAIGATHEIGEPFMKLVKPGRSSTRVLLLVTVVLGLLVAYVIPASASHPEVSLAGSDFEIDTDANLKVDDPTPSIDWAGVAETRKADTASGPNDESFGRGTKEDTAVPTVVDGGIPHNKSDLKFFGLTRRAATPAASSTCTGHGSRSRRAPPTWTSSSTRSGRPPARATG